MSEYKNDIVLLIESGNTVIQPAVKDDITWETNRKNTPGKLTFTVIQDQEIEFAEGSAVSLQVNGIPLFYGFVFSRSRDKSHQIKVTCYDQIKYLIKNNDTYQYENKQVDDVVRMIAEDYRLNVGSLESGGYSMTQYEEEETLYDIIQNAMDLTLMNTGTLFVLYDDFGKLTLKNIESMKTNILIDEETGENYTYTSSIDELTYNQIRLYYDNEETGTREVYIAKDSENINRWGVLQYTEQLNDPTSGQVKADALLEYYDKVTRGLDVSGCVMKGKLQAGNSVGVILNLGEIKIQNYMVAEKVTHHITTDHWSADLRLIGGEFI